jgi:N-acetylneuraminate synthase
MKLNNEVILENFGQPYFIAELNTSHFGDLSIAKQMVDAAKEAGADCVKFQSWSADTLYSNTYYRQNPIAKRVVDKFSFDQGELRELAEYAQGVGIGFASTPYSQQEADFLLARCDVPFVKIASMEINNLRFLEYVARTGTAIILSTGMADEQEIRRAVDCIVSAGNENLCVLHCVSIYPADPATINLNNIPALRELRDGLVVGYSDHTLGIAVPIAAVTLGAPVIEKHFTLDSKRIGMDNQMAMEPAEFGSMVSSCRSAWRSLGARQRVVSEAELAQRSVMRRSVVTLRAIAAGEVIRLEDLDFKRPGDGLSPEHVNLVIGKTAAVDIAADEVIYPPMVRQ